MPDAVQQAMCHTRIWGKQSANSLILNEKQDFTRQAVLWIDAKKVVREHHPPQAGERGR